MFWGILESKIETKQSFFDLNDLFASMLENKLEYSNYIVLNNNFSAITCLIAISYYTIKRKGWNKIL